MMIVLRGKELKVGDPVTEELLMAIGLLLKLLELEREQSVQMWLTFHPDEKKRETPR